MEDALRQIKLWAGQRTPNQFYTDVSARAGKEGYEAELVGNTMTVYKVLKEGGFLGIGGRQVRKAVIKVIRQDNEVTIPEEPFDQECVRELAGLLKPH